MSTESMKNSNNISRQNMCFRVEAYIETSFCAVIGNNKNPEGLNTGANKRIYIIVS